MIKIAGVRFRNAGKVFYFDPKDFALSMGNHVIVETARGPEYGTVSARIREVEDDMVTLPLHSVIRIATEEDDKKIKEYRQKEREALGICREKIHKHKLNMKLVNAEYSFDGSKILFYFTADGRIDFRDLVKDLASVFRMRIELRQIGVRDETRMLGGLGSCGRELCCASYLTDFVPVSIKMAKEQDLSLNPAKISGVCGRLMCCLKNEEDIYEELNAKMPKVGEEAVTPDGISGEVIEVYVLRQRCRVLFEDGDSKEIQEYDVQDLNFRSKGRKGDKDQEDAPRSPEIPKRRNLEESFEGQAANEAAEKTRRRGSEKKRAVRFASQDPGEALISEEGAEGISQDGKPRQERDSRKGSGNRRKGKGGGEKAAGALEESSLNRPSRQRKGETGRGSQRAEDGRKSRPDPPEKMRGDGQKKQKPQGERGKRPQALENAGKMDEGVKAQNEKALISEDAATQRAKRPRKRRPKKPAEGEQRPVNGGEAPDKKPERLKEKAGGARGGSGQDLGQVPAERSVETSEAQAGRERSHEMSIYNKKN